jgi:hypothetical protein
MKNKTGKTQKSTKKKHPKPGMAAGALPKLARVMASPVETVNFLMQWLNDHFGLNLPVIPLPSWLWPLTSLWELPIIGGLPSHPLPWDISVDGSWPGIYPQTGSPPLMFENIVIHVQQNGNGSPN